MGWIDKCPTIQHGLHFKQAERLKSCKIKEGWMKNDKGLRMNDEGWWFQADICEYRVAFATENWPVSNLK